MLDRITAAPEAFMQRAPAMIQGNPFQRGFDAQETRTAQADTRAAAELERDQKTAFSQGLAGIVADPGMSDPSKRSQAVTGLAARTGQSQLALQTMGAEDTRRKQAEDRTLEAAAAGNVALARHYAQQNGITMPDAILNDGQIAKGLKTARDMGYEDPQQAATFAAEFKRTGDPVGASNAAGPPRPKPANVTPSFQVYNQPGADGTVTPYRFNQRTGEAEPMPGVQGPFMRPGTGAGGAGGGRPLNVQVKRDMWLKVHPGDEQGALDYAGGKRTMSAQDANKAALATVRSLRNEYGEPLYTKEEDVLLAAKRFSDAILGTPAPTSNLSTVTPSLTAGGDPNNPAASMTDEQLQEWLRQNGGAQ